ncbi:hypothetical protein LTR36_008929 [Oleoguttula mirabilis]|uniref:Uncharacterized protein n=1 Tax=Oleoguttula mirabilis TaxID=1507867 RepID=A0AAV9J7B8_9PEZI|nr:hypothetical protein LTR36_008929 [Oleoguttula mirabilis]
MYIDETDLYSTSSTFGSIGEKLYLHKIIQHEGGELEVAPMQRRGGQDVGGNLSERKRRGLRVQAQGTTDDCPAGTLPCLFMEGRVVPEGLIMLLRTYWVQCETSMKPAKGKLCRMSNALTSIYVAGSANQHACTFVKRSRVSHAEIDGARRLVTSRVGNLKDFFDGKGVPYIENQPNTAKAFTSNGLSGADLPPNISSRLEEQPRQDSPLQPGLTKSGLTNDLEAAKMQDGGEYNVSRQNATMAAETSNETQGGADADDTGHDRRNRTKKTTARSSGSVNDVKSHYALKRSGAAVELGEDKAGGPKRMRTETTGDKLHGDAEQPGIAKPRRHHKARGSYGEEEPLEPGVGRYGW